MAAAQDRRWLVLAVLFVLPAVLLAVNLGLGIGGVLGTILLLVWLGVALILFTPFLA